jgi:hypothetical protein
MIFVSRTCSCSRHHRGQPRIAGGRHFEELSSRPRARCHCSSQLPTGIATWSASGEGSSPAGKARISIARALFKEPRSGLDEASPHRPERGEPNELSARPETKTRRHRAPVRPHRRRRDPGLTGGWRAGTHEHMLGKRLYARLCWRTRPAGTGPWDGGAPDAAPDASLMALVPQSARACVLRPLKAGRPCAWRAVRHPCCWSAQALERHDPGVHGLPRRAWRPASWPGAFCSVTAWLPHRNELCDRVPYVGAHLRKLPMSHFAGASAGDATALVSVDLVAVTLLPRWLPQNIHRDGAALARRGSVRGGCGSRGGPAPVPWHAHARQAAGAGQGHGAAQRRMVAVGSMV